MPKKSVEKTIVTKEVISTKKPTRTRKSTKTKKPANKKDNKEIEDLLIHNFVSLQRVMTNLSGKFNELTNQISRLLELFETSAKVLAEKDFDTEKNNRENTKILEKLESVLEQNKTIARGLTLMHDKINEPSNYYPPQQVARIQPQQGQQLKPAQKTPVRSGVSEEYHKPISSNGQ